MIRLETKKLQYDINREAAEVSALSSGKMKKCEYRIGEEMLPSDQKRVIDQAKHIYSPLGKALEKQTKTSEGPEERHIKALEKHRKQLIMSSQGIIKNHKATEEEKRKRQKRALWTIKGHFVW